MYKRAFSGLAPSSAVLPKEERKKKKLEGCNSMSVGNNVQDLLLCCFFLTENKICKHDSVFFSLLPTVSRPLPTREGYAHKFRYCDAN